MNTTRPQSGTAAPARRPTTTAPVSPLKVAMASLIGTAVEWYDYFIYGMAAGIVFGPLFFPEFSAAAGTVAAFATFSVGFLARPLGGVIMGHFGDRIGRKSMLITSLMLMGIATVAIGLLPTYTALGLAAPVLLVTLRIAQGIGVGGEWGGAVLMAVEHAPPNRKGFYGSFPQMGVPGGLILANLVFLAVSTSLSDDAFTSWGWRVPFLLSAVLVAVGLVIRFSIPETPDFAKVKETNSTRRLPIVTVLRRNAKEVLLAAGAFIGNNALGYIFIAYVLSYSTSVLGMSRDLILTLTLVASAIWLVTIAWASALSDRFGRRRVLLVGTVGQTVFAAALLPLINTANAVVILIALSGTAVFLGVVYGPLAALYTELFSADVRYSGISLAYQIGAVLGGGLAPTVSAALYAASGSWVPVSLYLVGVSMLSLFCIAAIRRRTTTAG